MKKILLSLFALATISASAATFNTTATCAVNSVTNVPTYMGGGFYLISAQVSSVANNSATIALFDTAFTGLAQTNPAYSSITSYVTNYINSWTNFYGATNYWTNRTLIDVSNYVAGATNALSPDYVWVCPTNSTLVLQNLNNRFQNGVSITNMAGGSATVVLTYTQP